MYSRTNFIMEFSGKKTDLIFLELTCKKMLKVETAISVIIFEKII